MRTGGLNSVGDGIDGGGGGEVGDAPKADVGPDPEQHDFCCMKATDAFDCFPLLWCLALISGAGIVVQRSVSREKVVEKRSAFLFSSFQGAPPFKNPPLFRNAFDII